MGPVLGLGVAALFAFVSARAPRGRRAPIVFTAAVVLCIAWNWRLTQFYAREYLPKNPSNAADYGRDFQPGHAYRSVWRLWDYGRWFREAGHAESRMWR